MYCSGFKTAINRSTDIAAIVKLFTNRSKLPSTKTTTSKRSLFLPNTSMRESTQNIEPSKNPVRKSDTERLMNRMADGVRRSFLGFLKIAYKTVKLPTQINSVLTKQKMVVATKASWNITTFSSIVEFMLDEIRYAST